MRKGFLSQSSKRPASSAKPEPIQPSSFSAFALERLSIVELLARLAALKLDEDPADEFLPETERRTKLVSTIHKGYSSMQRFSQLFPESLNSSPPKLQPDEMESWPQWKHPHLPNLSGPPTPDIVDQLIAAGDSIGKTIDFFISPSDKFEMNSRTGTGEDADDLPEVKRALMQFGYEVDAGGPSSKAFGPRPRNNDFFSDFEVKGRDEKCPPHILLEAVDVRRAILTEDKTPKGIKFDKPITTTHPVPIIVVRYSILQSPQHTRRATDQVMRQIVGEDVYRNVSAYTTTPSQTGLIADILLHNASLLSPAYIKKMLHDVPQSRRHLVGVSFFVPLQSVEEKIAAKLTAHKSDSKTRCAMEGCEKTGCKLMCSKCKSVFYCTKEHSTEGWSLHKISCLRSQHPDLFVSRAIGRGRVLVPLVNPLGPENRYYASVNIHTGTPNMYDTQSLPRNRHGSEQFLVKIQYSGRKAGAAPSERDKYLSGILGGPMETGEVQACMLYDEGKTVYAAFGPRSSAPSVWTYDLQVGFAQLRTIILSCSRWDGRKAFFYAYRVGDQLEVDLNNLPSQEHSW